MAAPKFAPVDVTAPVRGYTSPEHVPTAWVPGRPGEIHGFQPAGGRLGFQGPDQGFALKIANGFADRLQLTEGERRPDAIRGCLAIALRRASMFSRAPVVHDLTVAFTIWGYLDPAAPAELVALRRTVFEGLGNPAHGYDDARMLVDAVPPDTLRMTPQQAAAAYPGRWRELVGAATLAEE